MTQEQIVQLIEIILPFILTTIVLPLIVHLISLLPTSKQKTATAKATQAVQAVEQLAQKSTTTLSSDTKKSLAKSALQDILKAAGISLDSGVLDTLIESAVYLLNQTQASTPVVVPAPAPTGPLSTPASPTATKQTL
jgi:hypothetical protein